MTILVVEDEVIIADNICDTLEEFGYDVQDPAMSYSEAIRSIEAEEPHLAILDIRLAGRKSGIDLGNTINEKYDFPFIFLTSNSDKVTFSEAKRVDPYAFLVKPYSKDELFAAIELALYTFSKKKESLIDQNNMVVKDALFIKDKQCFVRINFEDIHYIQSDNVYLDIHLISGKSYTVRASLNDYLSKLDAHFIRSHRSYIINLRHLESVGNLTAKIYGKDIPIGRKHREDLLLRLNMG